MFKKKIEINIGILAVLFLVLLLSVFYNLKSANTYSSGTNARVGFDKKQDCAVYKKQIEDKFEKNNNSGLSIEYYDFDRIFYSPTKDSCLFVYSGSFGIKAGDRYRMLYLEDALSGEVLIDGAVVIEQGKFLNDSQVDFNDRVKEYES